MEKKTKIILGVVAVLGIAYLTRDKWMSKKEEKTSGFLGFSFGKKNKVNPQGKHYLPLSGNSCRKGDTLINIGTAGNPIYRCSTNKPSLI